jgi:hypothetical protein
LDHDRLPGRLWAIGELRDHVDDLAVQSALRNAAELDTVEAVRKEALDALSALEVEN